MRILSVLVIVVGLLLAAFSFLFYASAALPYQDATPALLEAQAAQLGFWQTGMLVGLLVAVGGAVGFAQARRRRPRDRE